ncbi:MAG: site-specific integrase [Desulfitobacteriaceae bacterium]
MQGYYYRPKCTCPDKKKKCKCGATWSYIVDIGVDPSTGKRKQEKKGGFKTKASAQTACGIVIQEVEQGIHIKESEITFEDFSKEWLADYENTGKKKKESTMLVRNLEIARLLPFLGKSKLKDVTRKQYQGALNGLKEKKLSQSTIVGSYTTGRMIFKKAVEFELIKNDPTRYASVPKSVKTIDELEEEEEIIKYLEKSELKVFLQTAKDKGLGKDYLIFLLLGYTGMRVGEMCALKWKDIDLVEGSVNITKTYFNPTCNAKKYKLTTPKTKASKRKISIEEIVLEELKKHKAKQNIVIMKNRDSYHDKDFIFAKEVKDLGYPEHINTIGRHMHSLLKKAGLNTSLTPHSLRHTHTSLLAEAGVSLPEIMERLGHKDAKTTTWVYTHTTQTMKKEASRKFSELMKSL